MYYCPGDPLQVKILVYHTTFSTCAVVEGSQKGEIYAKRRKLMLVSEMNSQSSQFNRYYENFLHNAEQ